MAIAYVLFKMIAAVIALVLFPIVTPLLVRASKAIDGVTLLAAYQTAYNVVGVLVLLPFIDRFTRLVEALYPLTDYCCFDILQFHPGWEGTECNLTGGYELITGQAMARNLMGYRKERARRRCGGRCAPAPMTA